MADPAGRAGRVVRTVGAFEQLAGQPIAAELMTGSDSPCSEVVFAFLGDDSVHVLDLCELGVAVAGDGHSHRYYRDRRGRTYYQDRRGHAVYDDYNARKYHHRDNGHHNRY